MQQHRQDMAKLESALEKHEGLEHVRIRGRGKTLTLYSGTLDDPIDHARFTELRRGTWGLSLPRHTGRWERTPISGTWEEVLDVLVRDFGFYLEDIRPHVDDFLSHVENRDRTKDPSH